MKFKCYDVVEIQGKRYVVGEVISYQEFIVDKTIRYDLNDELADNLQSVIDYFGGSVPFDRAERWTILQDWENEEELFDFLDKKDDVVYEYDGIYEDTFVHEHPELFVFDGTYTIPE